MPELPEVEAVTRKLQAAATGARIVSSGQYRPTSAAGIRKAAGRSVLGFERRGKNILAHLSGEAFLRVHLKMTGNFQVIPDIRLRPLTVRVWFGLEDGRGLVLDDPRALGRVSFHASSEREQVLDGLGIEPFDPAFTAGYLKSLAAASRKPIKPWLMDQSAVVGLGNIYAAEALFQARINPETPARDVAARKLTRLHAAIGEILQVAVKSAIIAYERPGGFTEGELFPVAVYDREGEPCFRCRTAIRRIPQAGRSTYFCPRCQSA